MVAKQRARLAWPRIENHQVALGLAFDDVAQVVHQCRHHAEERTRRRAWLERVSTR
ncbi:hypothetical protein D3C84_1111600 [compost metagenome]